MGLEMTRLITEMCNTVISCGVQAAGPWGWQLCHLHVPILLKFWEPQLPETLKSFSTQVKG